MHQNNLKHFLDQAFKKYNRPSFIKNDPVSIPHLFIKKQDIEIAGFFAAVFAWGQRNTIINKCNDMLQRMDHAPHDFILNCDEKELKRLLNFKHRTFNDTDMLYFTAFFKYWYQQHESLEDAFAQFIKPKDKNIENGLVGFRQLFFSKEVLKHELAAPRTRKHISSPAQNSACKRLNMFLRWMVRNDKNGVDFGLWQKIKPAQLICPLDLHVNRVALKLGLLQRTQSDWKAALELTKNLKRFDSKDPVKYDFALFGLGVMEKF